MARVPDLWLEGTIHSSGTLEVWNQHTALAEKARMSSDGASAVGGAAAISSYGSTWSRC